MIMSRPGSTPYTEHESIEVEETLRELADSINMRLIMLDDGSGGVRRRFIAALLEGSRRQANKRVTLRAQKFVAQRGLCADCKASLDARRLRPGTLPDEPLRCVDCMRRPRTSSTPIGSE